MLTITQQKVIWIYLNIAGFQMKSLKLKRTKLLILLLFYFKSVSMRKSDMTQLKSRDFGKNVGFGE